jgi:hypothetical protein
MKAEKRKKEPQAQFLCLSQAEKAQRGFSDATQQTR